MTIKQAKTIVKASFPRAKCMWNYVDVADRQFQIPTYRCGELIGEGTTSGKAWKKSAENIISK